MSESSATLDLLIIGAGPAGLSAALTAQNEGLSYLVLEKGLIADTIYRYPVGLTVFSTPNELELRAGDLKPCREKPTREELLSYYVRLALNENLNIRTAEEARAIEPIEGGFVVRSSRTTYRAARVLVAIGGLALPRQLGAPGEDLPKVHSRFVEAYPYVRKDALVVGGGNSAAEAALFLAEEGAHTTFAIWPSDWGNLDPKKGAIKEWVRRPLERQIEMNRLRLLQFERVAEIRENSVSILTAEQELVEIPNDVVFVLIGSDPDLTILRQAGVETITLGLTEVPVYDPETFETNVPGIYVAGHFTNSRHINDAIAVPRRIVPHIAHSLRAAV
ncbi:MAG: NAD(P)-binding domain-containing protein [Pyrinomonadaceae bacterium]